MPETQPVAAAASALPRPPVPPPQACTRASLYCECSYFSKAYFNDVHRTSQPYLAFKASSSCCLLSSAAAHLPAVAACGACSASHCPPLRRHHRLRCLTPLPCPLCLNCRRSSRRSGGQTTRWRFRVSPTLRLVWDTCCRRRGRRTVSASKHLSGGAGDAGCSCFGRRRTQQQPCLIKS